jgi:hypothetical protein
MSSAELTFDRRPQELAVETPHLSGRPTRSSGQPRAAGRGRCHAACHAIAWRLRRALAECARAWALAAGVPPHLYD